MNVKFWDMIWVVANQVCVVGKTNSIRNTIVIGLVGTSNS